MHREKENPLPDCKTPRQLVNAFNDFVLVKIGNIHTSFPDTSIETFQFDDIEDSEKSLFKFFYFGNFHIRKLKGLAFGLQLNIVNWTHNQYP